MHYTLNDYQRGADKLIVEQIRDRLINRIHKQLIEDLIAGTIKLGKSKTVIEEVKPRPDSLKDEGVLTQDELEQAKSLVAQGDVAMKDYLVRWKHNPTLYRNKVREVLAMARKEVEFVREVA